jgi:hypothetical protein
MGAFTSAPLKVQEREHCWAIVDAKGQDVGYQDKEAYRGPGAPAGSVTSRGRSPEELRANALLWAAAPVLFRELDAICAALEEGETVVIEPGSIKAARLLAALADAS